MSLFPSTEVILIEYTHTNKISIVWQKLIKHVTELEKLLKWQCYKGGRSFRYTTVGKAKTR